MTVAKLVAAILIGGPLAGLVAGLATRQPEIVAARPIYHAACTVDTRRQPVNLFAAWKARPGCTEGLTVIMTTGETWQYSPRMLRNTNSL